MSILLCADARFADALSDALLSEGALSVGVEDADAGTDAEAPLYGEPGMPVQTVWPQSLINAYKWYAVAAAQGDSESKAFWAEFIGSLKVRGLTGAAVGPAVHIGGRC